MGRVTLKVHAKKKKKRVNLHDRHGVGVLCAQVLILILIFSSEKALSKMDQRFIIFLLPQALLTPFHHVFLLLF